MGLFFSTPQCCSEALVEGLFIAFGWHYLSPSPPQPYLLPASRTNLCAFLLWASPSPTLHFPGQGAGLPSLEFWAMFPRSVKPHACSWPPHSVRAWATAEVKSRSGLKMFKLILIFLLPFIFSQDTVWDAPPQQEEPGAGLFSLETQYWTVCLWAAPHCSVRMVAVVSRHQRNLQ